MFIRANSGGTRLSKSDLLFSLLNSSWDHADQQVEELLEDLNRHGFAFTRDFVLKTCLTILNTGARYEVEKFRKVEVLEKIEDRWEDITKSIKDVLDYVRGKTYIHCDKALPSYLVLIPIVYLRFHFPDAWKQAKDLDTFVLRSLLAGAFSGTPDQLIDNCVDRLRQLQAFSLQEMFGVIRSQNRSLDLTEDRFWKMGYGSDSIHLLFNLWYGDFIYTPAYDGNSPQIDHIFPQSLLRKVKMANPETGKMNLTRYKEPDRNQLANCMLLTQQENGAGGKGDTPPDIWFAKKPDRYLDMHLIPKNHELWKLARFEDFISERRNLIKQNFGYLLLNQGLS